MTTPAFRTETDKALWIIGQTGAVFAGQNTVRGCIFRVSASTLRKMDRQGLVSLSIGPDGGMMARTRPQEVG